MGRACVSGACACPAPLTMLPGGGCADLTRDPNHCGAPGNACGDTEYCVDGMCVCRPGLVAMGADCIDPSTDADACGPMAATCGGGTPFCADGVCVAMCPRGTERCGDACVDTESDPLNCGGCGDSCGADQVCRTGNCRDYEVPAGCAMCPCPACGGDTPTCCSYPMTTDTICVEGDRCP